MTLLKFLLVSLLAIVASECENCEADDIQLLQAHKAEEKDEKNDENGPDFSKIMDAARQSVKSGMTKVTGQLTTVIQEMDEFASGAEEAFNESMATYKKVANTTQNVSQNLTKFKALVKDTIAEYVPFYSGAVGQLTGAVQTAKMVVKMLGKEDLEEKLNEVNETVTSKLQELARSSAEAASSVAASSQDAYQDTWNGLKEKLDYIYDTTGSFKDGFNEKLQSFTGVLQEPLKIALGEEATTQIFTLTNSTAKMLEKLQHLTMVYKTGLAEAADEVDTAMTYAANHQGWFSRIFGGLFR